MRMFRWVLAVLVLALLAACSGQDAGDGGAPMTDERGIGGADSGAGGEAANEEAPDGADPAALGDLGRQVITTADLTVSVGNTRQAADDAVRITEEAGGRVDERSEQAAGAFLVLRVPAPRLTAVLDRLDGLGEHRQLSIRSQDVTRATRDLDARITALETSVDRLLAIMAQAGTSEALIDAEAALSERQADPEALRSERDYPRRAGGPPSSSSWSRPPTSRPAGSSTACAPAGGRC